MLNPFVCEIFCYEDIAGQVDSRCVKINKYSFE